MEENKKVNIEVNEVEETVEETKSEGFKSKVVGAVKRHGKKVAIGIAGVVGLGLAYALGRKSADEDEDESLDDDVDMIEIEITDMAETE